MNKVEKCLHIFYTQYKVGFRKKLNMHIFIYSSYIQCEGVTINDGSLSEKTQLYDIKYNNLYSVEVTNVTNQKCLMIRFNSQALFVENKIKELYVFGLDDFEDCRRLILHYRDLYRESIAQQIATKEDEKKRIENEATDFYNECYQYHIKEETPKFVLFSDNNRVVLIYIDENKGMNFLKINGYEKNEDVGVIPYEKIHYYEKAGNIHYVSETNGAYSSFGGSLTGATFSKKATLFSGLLFGPMGMATAALMSYKPSQQKESETHFDISSDTKRIDERNVILNFYSDDKKQYVDIELPQEIYNFLQTHIPDKKFAIVSELEKYSALQNAAKSEHLLNTPAAIPHLPEKQNLSVDEFKEKVEKLKLMYDSGLITDEEYIKAKYELIENI